MKQAKRTAEIFLICLAMVAPAAMGQVAVPSIVPAGVMIGEPVYGHPAVSFVPPNPAVLQWGAPTRWGGGSISASRTQTAPSAGSSEEFSGIYLGGISSGEDLSYAGAYLDLGDQTNLFSLAADWSLLAGGVAFKSGDRFAFGASLERTSTTRYLESLDFNTTRLGLSVQISRAWYGGVALGTESLDSSFLGSGSRSVTLYGVGYRSGGREHVHLELYVIDREAAQLFFVSNEFSDATTTAAAAEVQLGDIVVAANVASTVKAQADIAITSWGIDLGWAPKRGISLLYHLENATTVDSLFGEEYESSGSTVSFAYAF